MDRSPAALLAQISAYGAHDAVRELPPEVMHHAKRAVIDWFSALYPGTRVPPATLLVRAHAAELGAGRSSLPGFGTTAFPALAAWINGTAAHSVEFDDIFRDAVYHPGCPVIAAALAVAEDRGRSGRELLNAITVGYEISTRIGAAVQPSHYRYFHTTGTVGAFGAAAAAAVLVPPAMRASWARARDRGDLRGGTAAGVPLGRDDQAAARRHAASVGVTSGSQRRAASPAPPTSSRATPDSARRCPTAPAGSARSRGWASATTSHA
jgi:hypothetical protein